MSAFMTCHLYMDPLRHLRLLPSSPAGFRSTFDRLPYGCLLPGLLFMYRLDLTVFILTPSALEGCRSVLRPGSVEMKVNISRNSCEMCDRATLNVSGAWALALATCRARTSRVARGRAVQAIASKGGARAPALIISPPRPARV